MTKKKTAILALALILCIGIVSAGLLEYYGQIKTTADVKQAILFDGQTGAYQAEHSITGAGGECYGYTHYLQSQTSVPINLAFTTDSVEGITTKIYELPETTTLKLENKDQTTWNVKDDEIKATLTFTTVSKTFDFTLEGKVITAGEYALIYYADKENRFDPSQWGGDNPGKIIYIFNTTTDGSFSVTATTDIGMNLPTSPDANIDKYSYRPDEYGHYYIHSHGAKIWIVPTADLSEGKILPVKNWNPTKFLFETDLVVYFDTDANAERMNFSLEGWGYPEIVTPFTLEAGERVDFIVCYKFDRSIEEATYTITTTIKPVS